MTTYNTRNPIGSTDARDRLDNSENMDILENSTTKLTHPDRLGTLRKTRYGMEVEHDAQIAAHELEHDNKMQSFENDFDSRLAGMAFTRVGSFTTGATLTDMRQVLIWEVSQGGDGHEYGWTGTFPKVVSAGTTPATSGGIGAGAWVDRTDVTLRDEVDKIAVARSLNVTNGNVIYLSDTTTVLDDVLYIYDFIAQEAWRKPSSVGTGETIVSISNGILTTSSGVYNIFKSTHRFVVYARDFGITSSSGPEDNLFDNYNALIEFVNSTGGGVDIVFDNESEIYLNEIIDFTLPIEQIKFVRYIQVPNTRWYFNGSKITCKGNYHKTLGKNNRTPQVTLCPIIIWEADNTEIHDVIIDGRSYETTKDASVFPEWPDTQGKYEFRSGQGVCCYCSEKVLLKNISAINHTVDGLFISRFSAGLVMLTP